MVKRQRGENEGSTAESSTSGLATTPTKRHKGQDGTAAKPRRRTRAGCIGRLTKMPIDISYEVLGHLEPMDLLNLARTSKSLRDFVLNRSMISTWQRAIQSVGLPPCPSDMNEIQYTEFMCSLKCDYCFKLRKLYMFWTHRTKACENCLYKHRAFITGHQLFYNTNVLETQTYYRNGCIQVSALKAEYDDHNLAGQKTQGNWPEWSRWVSEKKQHISSILKSSEPLQRWIKQREEAEIAEQARLKDLRYQFAIEKLKEEGWGTEIELMNQSDIDRLKQLKCINAAKALPEKAWIGMKKEVVTFAEKVKNERLDRELLNAQTTRLKLLKDAVFSYIKSQPMDDILPLVGDFAVMPEFSALIRAPTETEITLDDFNTLLEASADVFTRKWRDSCDDFLLTLIQDAGVNLTRVELQSPTTTFECRHCSEVIFYPQVLTHKCCFTSYQSEEGDKSFSKILHNATGVVAWNSEDYLKFSVEDHQRAKRIMETYNFDFEVEDLLRVPLFECLDCPQASRRPHQVFMTWHAVLAHDQMPRHPDEELGFRLLSNAETESLLEDCWLGSLRKSGYSVANWRWPSYHKCARCHLGDVDTFYASPGEHSSKCSLNVNRKLVEGVDFLPHWDILSAKIPGPEERLFKVRKGT